MASGSEITSQEYIQHHLQNLTVGEGFWALHLDTLGWSIFLGVVFLYVFRSVAKQASTGVPGNIPWPKLKMWPSIPFTESNIFFVLASIISQSANRAVGSRFP